MKKSNITEMDLKREDIFNILHSMEEIRIDNLETKNTSKNSEQYLNLASNLAMNLKDISENNPAILNKILDGIDFMTRSNSLLSYDPIQDSFWKDKNSAFVNNLTELWISIAKETFSSTKERYHLLQAIKCFKYITCSEDDLNEELVIKDKIYNTILPVQKEFALKDDSIFKRIGAFFLGETYDVKSIDNFTLELPENITLNSLDSIISKIDGKGYRFLKLKIPKDELDILIEKYPNYSITNLSEQNFSRRNNSGIIDVEMALDKNSINENIEDLTEINKREYKKILKYLKESESNSVVSYFTEKTLSSETSLEKVVLPNNNGIIFSHTTKIDDYNKYDILMYKDNFKNLDKPVDTYLLTMILSDKQTDSIPFFDTNPYNDQIIRQELKKYPGIKDLTLVKTLLILNNTESIPLKQDRIVNTIRPVYGLLRDLDNDR
ncbi:MAG: hypothetical protein ACP5N1_01515 [Candidatus Woesearchaeota archaeon]